MEVLVVTLAYTTPVKDVDTLARVQLVQETIRNTQGLVTSRFYRGRGSSPCYAILTTWESDEAWKQAQVRYNPKQLLSSSAVELFVSPPEQLIFTYLWGYIRPVASPELAAIHLAIVRPEQADVAQRGWIEGLKRQATHSSLAFGFLARGTAEPPPTTELHLPHSQGSTFLNLLSWASDRERENFYTNVDFTAVHRFITGIGTMQIMALEPL